MDDDLIYFGVKCCTVEWRSIGVKIKQVGSYNASLNMRREAIKNQKALDSLKRYEMVLQQEECVSKQFQLENFYSEQQLNLEELKRRIRKHKNPHTQTQPCEINQKKKAEVGVQWSRRKEEEGEEEQESDKVTELISSKVSNPSRPSPPKKAFFNTTQKKQPSDRTEKRRRLYTATANQWLQQTDVAQPSNCEQSSTRYGRFRSYNPSAMGRIIKQIKSPSQLSSIESVNNLKPRRTHKTNMSSSKCSSKLFVRTANPSWSLKKVLLQSEGAVNYFEDRVGELWEHYELLSSILMDMRMLLDDQRERLIQYREAVCSSRFEFINQMMREVQMSEEGVGVSKIAFLGRIAKAILHSRLQQNLSTVLICLYIANRYESNSSLTNMLGYATSNILFTLDLLRLTHQLPPTRFFSPRTEKIFEAMDSFEESSYNCKMTKLGDVVSRIQQNNDVMSILRHKLLVKMDKQVSLCISKFAKPDQEIIPFFEYSRYIFQFLAFQIHSEANQGGFKEIAIAPKPYVNKEVYHKRTIVIQPWGVLVAQKKLGGLFVRANTSFFLKQLAKDWNIIYWTDKMPKQLDQLLERMPKGQILYRYHCKQESGVMIKLLDRLGTDLSNTIIIDRSAEHFKYNRSMGVQLPWHGEKKDSKLLTLLELLMPLSNFKHPLSRGMASVQSLMTAIQPAKKIYRSRVKVRQRVQHSVQKMA